MLSLSTLFQIILIIKRNIKLFLDQANHPDAQYSEWFKWAEKFREQYRNLGAEVDS